MQVRELLETENPLGRLQLELWLQHEFDFDDHITELMLRWLLDGEYDDELDETINDLTDVYRADIPYGVIKDLDPVGPDEWLWSRLHKDFGAAMDRL